MHKLNKSEQVIYDQNMVQLERLGNSFSKELTEGLIEEYMEVLCDDKPDVLKVAVDRIKLGEDFFPKIKTINDYYSASYQDWSIKNRRGLPEPKPDDEDIAVADAIRHFVMGMYLANTLNPKNTKDRKSLEKYKEFKNIPDMQKDLSGYLEAFEKYLKKCKIPKYRIRRIIDSHKEVEVIKHLLNYESKEDSQ